MDRRGGGARLLSECSGGHGEKGFPRVGVETNGKGWLPGAQIYAKKPGGVGGVLPKRVRENGLSSLSLEMLSPWLHGHAGRTLQKNSSVG